MSASGARQVCLTRCSCLTPPTVTFTGYHGDQGVYRRTSGHASRLHVLYSYMRIQNNIFSLLSVKSPSQPNISIENDHELRTYVHLCLGSFCDIFEEIGENGHGSKL